MVLREVADGAPPESIGGVRINRSRRHGGPLGQCTLEQCPLIQLLGPPAYSTFDPGLVHLLGEEIMSYGASIYSHVYNPPITAEVLCGISRGSGWRPGTIVNS